MNWTYTLLHYAMNMDRSRSVVHVFMHLKLVRNSSCTAIHCMYLLLHVIGRERERRKGGRERWREQIVVIILYVVTGFLIEIVFFS